MRINTTPYLFLINALLTWSQCARAQASFVNLDFEQAVIVLDQSNEYPPFAAVASNALPGWSFNGNRVGANDINYNFTTGGSAAVSIHDINTQFGQVPILQGHYSVFLQGEFAFRPDALSVSLWQSGQIPSTARSLIFWGGPGAATFQITFNGQNVPFSIIGSGSNYNIYGGDISTFSGQTGELRFTALPRRESVIDNIQFFTQSIPEPSSFALFGLGTLLLGFFGRRNSSQ